jgi:glutathione S-transferase
VPRTRSFRVIWLCEELALPYRVERIDFSPEYRASAEWRRLNPVGKVPAMEDDGLVMFESGAMVEYILERYGDGRLRPRPGTHESARYLQWSWFAEATFARPLGDIAQHRWVKPEGERLQAVIDDATKRALVCFEALDAALTGRRFLMGDDFTAADIMMGYSVMLAERVGVPDERFAEVRRYHAALKERPGYAKGME